MRQTSVFDVAARQRVAASPVPAGALVTRAGFVVWSLLLKAALDFGYYAFVAPVYAYAGFDRSFSLDRLLVSYGLTVIFALGVARSARRARPSSIALVVLFGMLFLPILAYWALSGVSTIAMAIFTAGFALTVITTWVRLPSLATARIHPVIPLAIGITLGAAVFGIILARGGAQFINFSFAQVYDFRGDIYSRVITGFVGYLVPWYGKCVALLLMCYSLWKRCWLVFIALVGAQIVLFALTSNKEYAFYPLIVLLFLNIRRLPPRGTLIVGSFAIAAASAGVLYLLWGNVAAPAVILMRTFMAQALNIFQYFQFFQGHELVRWSNSVLSGLLNYPYGRPIPAIIGAGRYGPGSDAFANTGYLGSGFMQFGPSGVLIYGVLAGVMLRLFDVIAGSRLPLLFGGSVAFVAAAQLVNADLTIVFLSGGVFLSYILLFMLRTRTELSPYVAVGVAQQLGRG